MQQQKKQPVRFSQELFDNICHEVGSTSRSLNSILKDEGMPTMTTFFKWLQDEDKPGLADKYARAREAKADLLAEEILEIADDASNDYMTVEKGDVRYEAENKELTNRSRLRVDARKWLASKMMPRKYGDKVQTELSGELGIKQITGMEVK